jgi:hypothetical protein
VVNQPASIRIASLLLHIIIYPDCQAQNALAMRHIDAHQVNFGLISLQKAAITRGEYCDSGQIRRGALSPRGRSFGKQGRVDFTPAALISPGSGA